MRLRSLLPAFGRKAAGLTPVRPGGGLFGFIVREPFAGAWQKNEELKVDTALSSPPLFRCVSLISGDIAKVRLRLVTLTSDGVWEETDSPAFSPVLRKPNRYQTRIQFISSWMQSRLTNGNAYVLKVRDDRGVVKGLHVLEPSRVTPLVAPDGAVYYQLGADPLSGLASDVPAVPASEIIHDRWNTMFHPLVGLSPIFAAGLAAMGGLEIQRDAVRFFRNGSKPSGILTAPHKIDTDTAKRLKEHWETNYSGENAGKIAVVGDGLTYTALRTNADDAQLIDQLKWSAETVCGVFGVPGYMAGVGAAPLNNNVQSQAELYYSQCLQLHIESIELCLDEALGIGLGSPKEGVTYGVEFDLDDLLRMDTATQIKTLGEGVRSGILKPNEARRKVGFGKVPGGDAAYLQQQNFSLEALARRDAQEDPFKTAPAAASPAPAEPANDDGERAARFLDGLTKGLAV